MKKFVLMKTTIIAGNNAICNPQSFMSQQWETLA